MEARTRIALLTGVLSALVGVPIGFAIAQAGGDDDPVVTIDGVTYHDGPDDGLSTERTAFPLAPPAAGSDLPPGVVFRDGFAEVLSQRNATDDPNVIGSAPPPARLVKACQEDPKAEGSCGVALAMADGKLPPGKYTDKELEAAVADAGHEWRP